MKSEKLKVDTEVARAGETINTWLLKKPAIVFNAKGW